MWLKTGYFPQISLAAVNAWEVFLFELGPHFVRTSLTDQWSIWSSPSLVGVVEDPQVEEHLEGLLMGMFSMVFFRFGGRDLVTSVE